LKILLLNDNPVVTKLVTLSAQKTDDDVEIINNIDDLTEGNYDLFAVDDALYSSELLDLLKGKINFKKSLFICSRDNEVKDTFSSVIKKPFLPTDLVELFTTINRNLDVEPSEDIEELETLEEIEDLDDMKEVDALDLEEINDLETDSDDDFLLEDLDDEGLGESILDDDEAQKVKDLLDDELLDYDEALDLEDEVDENLLDDDNYQSEDEIEPNENLELEDISFDDAIEEDVLEVELDTDFADIESQIETAVADLDEEDLESEVDEDTLLGIANTELDSLDNINSKDLKLALGEDVEEVVSIDKEEKDDNDSVTALKKLLEALQNQDVAAAMKGAKITINITLGDD
jgi:uncharacterized membrane protein